MSLTGNVEDLPLLDILQIVSFSRKTGYLSIETGEGEGGIVFEDGLVVSAFTWSDAPIDARFEALPPPRRDGVIRTRIEVALEQLIRLRKGVFRFSLTTSVPTVVGSKNITKETLSLGINPQELILGLARGMDEDRRDSSAAVEAAFVRPEEPVGAHAAQPPPDTGATVPVPLVAPALPPPTSPASDRPESRASVLLVDDEEDVRRMLGDALTQAGYQVVEAEDPETAVKKGGRLGKQGIPFLLVADLGMPTSGGSSFQGGFEVVKRLGKMHLRPPVLMMTERINPSIQLRARQMGIAQLVFKPGLARLNPEQFEADVRAFAGKIARDVLPRLGRSAAASRQGKAAAPAAAPGPAAVVPTVEDLSRDIAFLQRRLLELRQPGDANQIAILVMKVAREFCERGILFLVKNEELRGLAAFGPAPRDDSINLLVRGVAIPLSEPSLFQGVVESGKPFQGPLPEGKWGRYLMGKIGRFHSSRVAVFPLVTHRETIAVLFGDNAETGSEFGRLEALELFVHQAGVALENVFLQKKVQSLQSKGETRVG